MSDRTVEKSRWLQAEKWYLRSLGAGLVVVAILGIFFSFYGSEGVFALALNIMTIVILLLAGIASIWWSRQDERVERMISGFQADGAGRTYAVMIVQLFLGALFVLDGMTGRLASGALGIIILGSAGFYFWRARQISANL